MNNFSTTQTTNLASIVGVLILILNHFHVNIANDELTTVIGGCVAVGGVLANWYHRYQQGDLTAAGFRRN